ncbi:MAG: MFS transporter [Ilumatobacteraceae bacterium]
MRVSTHPTAGTRPHKSPWATFAVAATATYISTLDMSIVNVAFFEIGLDFPTVSKATISWVVTAYSIMFGSLLVVSGRLADQFGRKRMLMWGTVLFLLGSLGCAVTNSMGLLIAGRAVQGIGGAMMTPASTGLLLAAFSPEKRGQAMAWTGSIGALGVASGPTLGAFMVATFGWRSAFWVNVPICAVALYMTWRSTTESPRNDSGRPDVAVAVFFTAAVGSLVWGISRAEESGWSDATVLQLFAATIVLGFLVAWRSMRHADPLLPGELFRERTFTLANISTFLYGAAFSGNILNNVLFQRTIWEFGALKAGLFSVLSPITVAVTSMWVGKRMAQIGYRRLLIAGPLIMSSSVTGSVLLLDIEPTPWFPFTPIMFFLGIGLGSTFPALSACTVMRLPQTRFALGGAINNTFRQVGAAVGVALVVTVQTATEGIEGFRNGWKVAIVFAIAAAAVSLFQPGRAEQV